MDENGGIHVAYHIDGSYDDIGYAAVRSLTHRPQFEIEPTLPIGMFLGAENGTIYGTPSVFTELTEYTVWANTTSTSASTTLSMNVDWELMASVDYLEVAKNTVITPITSTGPLGVLKSLTALRVFSQMVTLDNTQVSLLIVMVKSTLYFIGMIPMKT